MSHRLLILCAATILALCPATAAFPQTVARGDSSKEQKDREAATEYGGRMAETVDLRSVLAALGLLSGTFLAVLLGLRVYLHCLRRRPQRESRRKKMTEEEINQRFPVTRQEGEPTCVVCLSTIEADDKCRVTQCGHAFHADCLVQWWTHKPKRILRCPICRTRQRLHNKKSKVSAEDEANVCCPGAGDQELPQRTEGEVGSADQEQEEQGQQSPDEVSDHQLETKDNEEDESPSVSIVVAAESPTIGVVVESPQGDDELAEGIPLEDRELDKEQVVFPQMVSV